MAGKQDSSLKLCPAEREDIKGEQERSLKLLPMEAVTGEEECSLKICPTKRKAPTTGHLPPLKGGAMKRKGEACSSEEVDEIEEQAISDNKVAAATQKGAPGTGFSELDKTMGEEEKAFPEAKGTVPDATVELDEKKSYCFEKIEWSDCSEDEDDDDRILSEAEYQVIVNKAKAKYNRYMEVLLARTKHLVFAPADYADSDDEKICA